MVVGAEVGRWVVVVVLCVVLVVDKWPDKSAASAVRPLQYITLFA